MVDAEPVANTISDNAAINTGVKGQERQLPLGKFSTMVNAEPVTVEPVGPRTLAPCVWCGGGRFGCPSLGGDLCERCALDASLDKCIECGGYGRELYPCDACDDALDYSAGRRPLRPSLHQECFETHGRLYHGRSSTRTRSRRSKAKKLQFSRIFARK